MESKEQKCMVRSFGYGKCGDYTKSESLMSSLISFPRVTGNDSILPKFTFKKSVLQKLPIRIYSSIIGIIF